MARKAGTSVVSEAVVASRLPDADDRDRIVTELDRTLLVEASAGTGKTTALIARMVALIRDGHCRIETLAAVTFTRKAAAEIRGRLQLGLECAAEKAEGEQRRRLEEARRRSEACFVGTIHSFCGRLLRERPVEAGVDPGFRELEEEEDARIRSLAWRTHLTNLNALRELGDDNQAKSQLSRLDEIGISPLALGSAFEEYSRHPDVTTWPAPEIPLPDLTAMTQDLVEYADHVRDLGLPNDTDSAKLIHACLRVERAIRNRPLTHPRDVAGVLELFKPMDWKRALPTKWPGGKEQAAEELEQWNALAEAAGQYLGIWREHRYAILMQALHPAREIYERLRSEANAFNFQDLLLRAAALLRHRPEVRQYFRRRFTHLLVDEFQDTDPVQAEVMLLLTATDPAEADWTRCQPAAGSLFVVGDPKQSIYRFRRADIVTYERVRQIIEATGGGVVPLRANFRSSSSVIEWVNCCFSSMFPQQSDRYRPADAPLLVGRPITGTESPEWGVFRLTVPDEHRNRLDVAKYEADRIGRTIRKWLDERRPVSRSANDLAAGLPDHVVPSDFLIVTRTKKHLADYGAALSRYGIAHEVTGGAGLSAVPELRLLRDLLRAVARPDDQVALVGVLRSELFGFADTTLFEFKRQGGRFSYRLPAVPGGLGEAGDRLRDVCRRLRRHSSWLRRLPAAAAVERIVADLGLAARACADEDGSARAGGLLKSIELLRGRAFGSAVEIADVLSLLLDETATADGATVLPPTDRPARIMNLHQCKGLEAPVVFLAEPGGASDREATLHVDRSSGRATGYLAIHSESQQENGPKPLLAHPANWADHQLEEESFLQAEEQRLLYVAATRAGHQLVISQRPKPSAKNPWDAFAKFLTSVSELPDPGPVPIACAEDDDSAAADESVWEQQVGAVQSRIRLVTRPTYAVRAIKELTVKGARKPRGVGDDGTQWGSLVHVLLEAAHLDGTDLKVLAESTASELGLDDAVIDEALGTVRVVQRSTLWQRAEAAKTRLVEVPFSLPQTANGSSDRMPTILRGVVDLAFLEPEGWVIVDYKSDRVDKPDLPAVIAHYEPQVSAYRDAWIEITGEPVKELGLFFTHTGEYAVLA